jgi:hypothetical protein
MSDDCTKRVKNLKVSGTLFTKRIVSDRIIIGGKRKCCKETDVTICGNLEVTGKTTACDLTTQNISPCTPGQSININAPITACNLTTLDIFPCSGDTIFNHAKVAALPVSVPVGINPYSVFKADGDLQNISLIIEPKGNGALVANEPDGTVVGGNNRGPLAVDLQRRRDLPTAVASGQFATITGGVHNTASGNQSFVGGGFRNTTESLNSAIPGGQLNSITGIISNIGGGSANGISGEISTIGGGGFNFISSNFSTIPGGFNNEASGLVSFAAGSKARALHDFTFAWGAGQDVENFTYTILPKQVVFILFDAHFITSPSPNTFTINGDLDVTGFKNFVINHPLLEDKLLRHTCVEAPRPDLTYRGVVQLVNGKAEVDIDLSSNMTPGTFSKLIKNPQIFLNNGVNWEMVKIEDSNFLPTGKFTIISINKQSKIIVDWLVIAERVFEREIVIEIDKLKPEPIKEAINLRDLKEKIEIMSAKI